MNSPAALLVVVLDAPLSLLKTVPLPELEGEGDEADEDDADSTVSSSLTSKAQYAPVLLSLLQTALVKGYRTYKTS